MKCKIVMLEKSNEIKNITDQEMGIYFFKGELYKTENYSNYTLLGIKTFSVISDGPLLPQIKDECNRTLIAEVEKDDTDCYQIEKIINIEPLPGEE